MSNVMIFHISPDPDFIGYSCMDPLGQSALFIFLLTCQVCAPSISCILQIILQLLYVVQSCSIELVIWCFLLFSFAAYICAHSFTSLWSAQSECPDFTYHPSFGCWDCNRDWSAAKCPGKCLISACSCYNLCSPDCILSWQIHYYDFCMFPSFF